MEYGTLVQQGHVGFLVSTVSMYFAVAWGGYIKQETVLLTSLVVFRFGEVKLRVCSVCSTWNYTRFRI